MMAILSLMNWQKRQIKMVAKLSTIRRKIRNGEKLGFSERARAVNKGFLPSKAKRRKNIMIKIYMTTQKMLLKMKRYFIKIYIVMN